MYVWILYDKMDLDVSVFTDPAHAFTSMERLYGKGLVKVISRRASEWKIEIKGNEIRRCRRRKVHTKPMSG